MASQISKNERRKAEKEQKNTLLGLVLTDPNWILNLKAKNVDFNINHESKENILEELNILGINEATLFPKLEYQAEYLKKYYGR